MLVCTCNPFFPVQSTVSFRFRAINFPAYKLISVSQNSVYVVWNSSGPWLSHQHHCSSSSPVIRGACYCVYPWPNLPRCLLINFVILVSVSSLTLSCWLCAPRSPTRLLGILLTQRWNMPSVRRAGVRGLLQGSLVPTPCFSVGCDFSNVQSNLTSCCVCREMLLSVGITPNSQPNPAAVSTTCPVWPFPPHPSPASWRVCALGICRRCSTRNQALLPWDLLPPPTQKSCPVSA